MGRPPCLGLIDKVKTISFLSISSTDTDIGNVPAITPRITALLLAASDMFISTEWKPGCATIIPLSTILWISIFGCSSDRYNF